MLEAVSYHTHHHVSAVSSLDLVNLAWSFAEMEMPADDLKAAISEDVKQRLSADANNHELEL